MKKEHWQGLKRRLRRQIRQSLSKMTCQEKSSASSSIVEKITHQSEFHKSQWIGIYSPIDWEINLLPLIEVADKGFALPRWRADLREYEFAEIHSRFELASGHFGIEEPLPDCPSIPVECIDLIFVPGIAFSQTGNRLGRGKGFYDRLLSSSKAKCCGVCHGIQIVDSIPIEDWDLNMDMIMTPEQSWLCDPSQT